MSNQAKVCWNASYYGVEIHAGKRRFVVSAMPNMVGRLDTAVRCMETMSGWRLPTFREMETIIGIHRAGQCSDGAERRPPNRP